VKKLALLLFVVLLTSGCSLNTTSVKSDISTGLSKVLTIATKINNITGTGMSLFGPIGLAGFCAIQPQDCPAAKAAYTLAVAAQKEYTQILADATAANSAADGLKLATLASTIKTHFATINSLIVASGGKDNSTVITDLSNNITELQNISK